MLSKFPFWQKSDNSDFNNKQSIKEVAMAKSIGFTFKPLARGRYKCNQTGKKTKNPEAYRRQMENRGKNQIPDEAKHLPKVKLAENGTWKCPNEKRHDYWTRYYNHSNKTRVIVECKCGQKVYITGRD